MSRLAISLVCWPPPALSHSIDTELDHSFQITDRDLASPLEVKKNVLYTLYSPMRLYLSNVCLIRKSQLVLKTSFVSSLRVSLGPCMQYRLKKTILQTTASPLHLQWHSELVSLDWEAFRRRWTKTMTPPEYTMALYHGFHARTTYIALWKVTSAFFKPNAFSYVCEIHDGSQLQFWTCYSSLIHPARIMQLLSFLRKLLRLLGSTRTDSV